MKKLCLMMVVFLTILLSASSVNAFSDVYTLATNITSTAGAQTAQLTQAHVGTQHKFWTCFLVLNGSVTSASVRIEGSEWPTIFSPTGVMTITCTAGELTAGICQGISANAVFNYLRANVLGFYSSGGGKISNIVCRGSE